MIDNKISLLPASTILIYLYSGLTSAADERTPTHVTINQIVNGEGKAGDTATSQNGEVVYVVLEGGIIEMRNIKYKTTFRYNFVKANINGNNN